MTQCVVYIYDIYTCLLFATTTLYFALDWESIPNGLRIFLLITTVLIIMIRTNLQILATSMTLTSFRNSILLLFFGFISLSGWIAGSIYFELNLKLISEYDLEQKLFMNCWLADAIFINFILFYTIITAIRDLISLRREQLRLQALLNLFPQVLDISQDNNNNNLGLRFEDPNLPLTDDQIDNLPRKTIDVKRPSKSFVDHNVCAICTEIYTTEDLIISLPCNHFYHKNCIKSWLLKKGNCPYCNKFINQPIN